MFRHLPSLKALRAFEAAARHGSFARAAEELAVSAGAISYQVKRLETALATPLFLRRVRQVELTRAGERLFRTAHRQFRELDETVSDIVGERGGTALTVAVSTYFVTRWLSPRLGEFLSAHPDVTVRLQHSVNDPDFVLAETDIAIRWGDGRWPGSRSEPLMPLPMIAVCSPGLCRGDPPLRSPKDLLGHRLLRDQSGTDHWEEWLERAGLPGIVPEGPLVVDPNVRVQSAVDGHGVTLANPLVQPMIDDGRLREPFDVRLHGYGYHLVFGDRGERNPRLGRFRDWLVAEVARDRGPS